MKIFFSSTSYRLNGDKEKLGIRKIGAISAPVAKAQVME
jgi:hypothetical protein